MINDNTNYYVDYFLYPGMLFAKNGNFAINTILGSCVSVCLWDRGLQIGGMNHYLLPLWNGEGLPSPRYGNIAIPTLIEKMLSLGCKRETLVAKCFGGGAVLDANGGFLNVGERNILMADDILKKEQIRIAGVDVGGTKGRRVVFHTESGDVFVKKIAKTEQGNGTKR